MESTLRTSGLKEPTWRMWGPELGGSSFTFRINPAGPPKAPTAPVSTRGDSSPPVARSWSDPGPRQVLGPPGSPVVCRKRVALRRPENSNICQHSGSRLFWGGPTRVSGWRPSSLAGGSGGVHAVKGSHHPAGCQTPPSTETSLVGTDAAGSQEYSESPHKPVIWD